MKWINYHHLVYFKEIATHGSISKASKVLKVGQPALSSQLKSLEEYLGVKLFERRNRQLFLTEPGRVTLEYAIKISDLGQELIELVDDKVFTQKLHLTVGALDSIPKNLICDIVEFAHKETDCFLSILEDSMDGLLRQLSSHQIEVLIADHDINNFENEKILSKQLFKGQLSAFCSPKFENIRKIKKNFPQSLNDLPVIVPTKHSKIRKDVEHYFHVNDIRPQLIAETQDTALQKILSSRGDGIIFVPEFTTKEHIKEKKLVKLGELEHVFVEYYLIYSKRVIDNPALNLLIEQDFNEVHFG